ncbi:c-type cytochrome [Nitratifractor sp.]|uniref:c-type cytochrome n=1 Tax=Nitratifractor sp. TaxID=2268144 RepID=UPI0025D545A6|nr:c-type cytochrome [Nitratifractor sp.]
MIRHIIAAIATLLAIWAMVFMYRLDREANRFGEIQKLLERTKMEVKVEKHPKVSSLTPSETNAVKPQSKKEDEAAKKLKALQERAGNLMAFKVSPLYKQKCSSCHGVNGEGIIGPKLIGKSSDFILKALEDFKSGKRKNYVMYGLLSKMDEGQLKALAEEIGTFQQKLEASQKQ